MDSRRRLLSYIKPYWRHFTAGVAVIMLVTAVYLLVPGIIGNEVIDRIIASKDQSRLNLIIPGVILLFVVKGFLTYTLNYLMAYVGQRVVVDLRNEVFNHLQRMPLSFHESRKSGELVATLTNDIGLIQASLTTGLADIIAQSFLLVGSLIAAFVMNPELALLIFFVLPLVVFVVSRMGQRIQRISRRAQEKVASLSSILQETLSGIRIVKAFTMEEHQKKRFAVENEAGFQTQIKATQVSSILTSTIDLLFVATVALMLWYGGSSIIQERQTPGDFTAFILYLGMAATPLTTLTNTFSLFQRAFGGADRVFEVLDQQPGIQDAPDAITLQHVRGRIEYCDVTFCYRDEIPVLHHINLKMEPGEIVALVGPSGGGKTSLVSLIPRFYDPLEGAVLLDGHDLRQIRAESLRQQIGLVPQESILFGVSVRENITYGKPGASEAEIVAAAQAANAHDFIMALPEGYDTVLGERGASLSGGQRQRVAIARAVLRDPRILILDEATSALDTESERLVQEALERLMKGRTTLVIAHRLTTVQYAHRIIVLAGGKIVEQGRHQDLILRGGLYQRLYEAGMDMREESVLSLAADGYK